MFDQQCMDKLFQHTSDAVILVDDKNRIVQSNPACSLLLGYPLDELRNSSFEDIASEGTFNYLISQTIETKSEFSNIAGSFQHKDKHFIETHFSAHIWYSCDNLPVGSIYIIQSNLHNDDIQKKLEKSQRLESLGTLAGGITHDLNSVLSIATGNIMLSKQHIYRPEKMKLYLERIEDSCKRASDLCRQILAYSGMDRYTMTEHNPTELITSMQGILSSLEKHNSSIAYDLDAELPDIKVDTAQLQQVIVNLVNNAYEAVPPGTTPHIVVRTGQLEVTPRYFADAFGTRHSLSGQFIWLEVSDNGLGMDDSVRNRVFEPFFSTKHQSRGLGMSASLGIIRGHGGAIKVWSEPNKGTTVRILLPTSVAENEDIAAPIIDSIGRQPQLPSSLSGTILIVDDEEDIREMLRLNLESMGCHVLEASDGEEGLRVYENHKEEVSVILLDMAMPNMDGAEMMDALEALAEHAHIIVISGYSEKIVQGRFSNFKPEAFLYKPFEISELQTCLQQLLQEAA